MTRRVLAGLGLGIAAGAIAFATGSTFLLALARALEPIGILWVNAILMTVVPLVVASLIVGIASATDSRHLGRMGRRSAGWFLAIAAGSALLAALATPVLLRWLPLDPTTVASLRASAASGAAAHLVAPTPQAWLLSLVPANVVRAAADGAMLPLVLFSIVFGLALARIGSEPRTALLRVFEGIASAMRVVIGWVLVAAPVGVFALAFALASRVGAGAAGALAYYVVLTVVMSMALMLVLYVVALLAGRVSLARFARAAAPAQAVAFGSRSSLASLPALITGAERQLGVPPAVSGFVLPLGVAAFKASGPAAILVGLLFGSRLYGIALGPVAMAEATAAAAILSFAVPGVPGGWLLVAAPLFAALGVPVEAIGTMLAVDAIPDMFRTPVNVTADLVVTAIVARA